DRSRRNQDSRSILAGCRAARRNSRRRARGHCRWSDGPRQGDGGGHAEVQRQSGWEIDQPDCARGAISQVLDTLEFPRALARVALHAAGPLGAARVSGRLPDTDPDSIRAALAQVAELAALLITDETIRAEPVPDIAETLELLAVQGSALEAKPLAELKVALAAMRVTAADLKRLETTHDARRTGTLRTDPPPKELETKLTQSISPDGEV